MRTFVSTPKASLCFLRHAVIPFTLAGCLGAQGPPEVISTAHDRQALGITIYQNNLAMIRDQRRINLPQGRCRLAFQDVAATIKPKSAWMEFKDASTTPKVLERNYEFNLLSPASAVDHALGQAAGFWNDDGSSLQWGTLASLPIRTDIRGRDRMSPNRSTTLRQAEFDVLIKTPEGYRELDGNTVSLKSLSENLRARPTLLADLDAEKSTDTDLELAYTAEGLSWKANYVVTLDESGKTMDMDAWATVDNKSGTSFPNATLQLVAGEANQVFDADPVDLDKSMIVEVVSNCAMSTYSPQFKEEGLSELHLLTLDRPTTLGDGQKKQIKLFSTSQVPIKREYFFLWKPNEDWFESPRTRSQTISSWIEGGIGFREWLLNTYHPSSEDKALYNWCYSHPFPSNIPVQDPCIDSPRLILSFQNTESSHLGRPLPAGNLWIQYKQRDGSVVPLDQTTIENTPVGEESFVLFGKEASPSGLRGSYHWRPVRWEPRTLSDADKNGMDPYTTLWMDIEAEAVLMNALPEAAAVRVGFQWEEGFEMTYSNVPAKRFDSYSIYFQLSIPPAVKKL